LLKRNKKEARKDRSGDGKQHSGGKMTIGRCVGALALLALQTVRLASAQDLVHTMVLGPDFHLSPARLQVPANASFRLLVRNESGEGDRFGSDDLNLEYASAPGQTLELQIGPLKAGEYGFFGYLHRNTARAEIVAR
jgi:hypothetical protein